MKAALADLLLIFCLAACLIWPLFGLEYLNNWGSIESTFIADSRFLLEHWPHPRWQPLWYCGTRWDYIYPPALRYGTAAAARMFGVSTARGYHLYTAFFYCLGIAGVYLLVRLGSGSRGAGWLAAAAAAVLSPSFLFMHHIRGDAASAFLLPQRLNALVRYGEGPHMTALACLGPALAASWRALEAQRPAALALAAAGAALVVSNNFYGATALATWFPVLVWALWVTHRDRGIWFRAAAIVLLSYGLTAFWLVPSYVRVTLDNMKLVSQPGNAWSAALAVATALAFGLASRRFAGGRKEAAYAVFASGAALFMSLNVLGQYYFNFRVMGEPERLVPELDLALILLAVELLRRAWSLPESQAPKRAWLAAWRRPVARGVVILVVIAAFWYPRRYVRHAWELYPRGDHSQRVEYRLTEWFAKNAPDFRVAANGSLRFWFNAWHDLAQLGGGSEQGVLNQMVIPPQWEIALGDSAEPSVVWMKALGVDAVVVHDTASEEMYYDIVHPRKFAGVLPVLYDDQRGNVIYRIPRRFLGIARVVERAKLASVKPFTSQWDLEHLRAYVDAVENGPDRPAESHWEGPEVLRIRAELGPGEAILAQVSYDPGWRAYSNGRELPVRKDAMGLMLVEAPPGRHDLRLEFRLPFENAAGRIASALSALIALGLALAGSRTGEKKL